MRNSTNIFLVNLSVADLCVLVICTPTVLIEVNSGPQVWPLGEHMCKSEPIARKSMTHFGVPIPIISAACTVTRHRHGAMICRASRTQKYHMSYISSTDIDRPASLLFPFHKSAHGSLSNTHISIASRMLGPILRLAFVEISVHGRTNVNTATVDYSFSKILKILVCAKNKLKSFVMKTRN